MDSFYIFTIWQDQQDELDFPRFPDETVKAASVWRRKLGICVKEIRRGLYYQLMVDIESSLTETTAFSAKRIVYFRFHPETGNLKYPTNPVDPVFFKD